VTTTIRRYPEITIPLIKQPSRFFAFPLIGYLSRFIITIPIMIEIIGLTIAWFFLTVINSFFVLATGRLWRPYFDLTMGITRLTVRLQLYFLGLFDTYPGFTLNDTDAVRVSVDFPQKVNRLYALPLLGGIFRTVAVLPITIWGMILSNSAWAGSVGNSFVVLSAGRYTESVYLISKDAMRVYAAAGLYWAGISDTYPDLTINFKHKWLVILMLILGSLLFLNNFLPQSSDTEDTSSQESTTTPPVYDGIYDYD
jgi:hypothetical protein